MAISSLRQLYQIHHQEFRSRSGDDSEDNSRCARSVMDVCTAADERDS